MPETDVVFYRESDGTVPVRDWLAELMIKDRQAFAKCAAAIRHLAAFGYELRRPHVDLLRDGIYELRIRKGRVNFRILFFYDGRNVVVLAHGLIKEKAVPFEDIDRALGRKKRYMQNPLRHRAIEEVP